MGEPRTKNPIRNLTAGTNKRQQRGPKWKGECRGCRNSKNRGIYQTSFARTDPAFETYVRFLKQLLLPCDNGRNFRRPYRPSAFRDELIVPARKDPHLGRI